MTNLDGTAKIIVKPLVNTPKVTHIEGSVSGKDRNSENFPVGSLLIRSDLRTHIHALYNFARVADDIGDHVLMDPHEKIRQLNGLASTLLNKSDEFPVAIAMRKSLASTHITPQHCLDLLSAFKQDAVKLRYDNWEDLMDYCRLSASPVGRHVLALHGVGESAWPSSDALCSILQVINHIQDCSDDYRELDRVYIPEDMLSLYGGTISDLSRVQSTTGLRATLDAMLDKLETMMPLARQIPRQIPDFRLKCETAIIYSLAEKLLTLLRHRDPLSANVKLGKPANMGAVLIGLIRAYT